LGGSAGSATGTGRCVFLSTGSGLSATASLAFLARPEPSQLAATISVSTGW
jgi:hypothetical protein